MGRLERLLSVDVTASRSAAKYPKLPGMLHSGRWMPFIRTGYFLLVASLLIEGSESLFIEEVTGPGPVSAGADVVLHCKFDLEDDVLYAVKWFRFGREFYRFEPQRRPQIQIFPLDNVNVDREASNAVLLVIRS